MFPFLVGFSALSFIFYGISCLMAGRMLREFERFRLSAYRQLTGGLQLLAALGLVLSYFYPASGLVAAGGLSVQMAVGCWVRLKIGDSLLRASPALFYGVLNGYLFFGFLERLG